MIRKAIIVLLALGGVGAGTIGVLSGTGSIGGAYPLWSSGEWAVTGSRFTSLVWGPSRMVMVDRVEWLDASAIPFETRLSGPGWLYSLSVVLNEHSGLYARSSRVMVSFFIPTVLAVLLAAYPTIAFIRGPLRRWRRRRRGWCVKCGYDLTGNVTGVCPECGSEIGKQ